MRTKVLQLNKREIARTFWILVFLMIFLAGYYFYLINKTIWNVAERQNIEKSLTQLGSDTAEKESNYMALKSKIDLNMARSLGFNTVVKTEYINRTTLGQAATNKVE